MRGFRWTYFFVFVVTALVVFTVFDNKRVAKKEELTEQDKSMLKIPPAKLVRVEILNRVATTVLERPDPTKDWRILQPVDDSADQQAVQSYLSSLEAEKILQVVVSAEEAAKNGLQAFGLAEPLTRLRVKSDDGKTEEIRIGTVKAYDSNLYAQVDGPSVAPSAAAGAAAAPGGRVLLVSSGWDTLLTKPPVDFRDKHLLRHEIALGQLTRLTIKHGSAQAFELAKEGEHWKVIRGAPVYLIDDTRVGVFLDQIKGVRATSFLEGSAAVGAKKLLASPVLSLALYTDKKEPEFTASFALEPKSAIDEKATPKKPLETVSASSDLKELVKVNRPLFDAVAKTPQDFYDKRLPFAFTNTEIAKIELDSKENKAAFEKRDGIWKAIGDGKREADGGKITDLLVKLGDLSASHILEASVAKNALGHPSRIVLMKADGTVAFELAWGAVVTDPAPRLPDARPALTYAVARTRKGPADAGQAIGIAEADLKALPLTDLYKAVPTPTSTPISKTVPATLPATSASPAH